MHTKSRTLFITILSDGNQSGNVSISGDVLAVGGIKNLVYCIERVNHHGYCSLTNCRAFLACFLYATDPLLVLHVKCKTENVFPAVSH